MRVYPSTFPPTSANRPHAAPVKVFDLAIVAAASRRAGCADDAQLTSTMSAPDGAVLEECASR